MPSTRFILAITFLLSIIPVLRYVSLLFGTSITDNDVRFTDFVETFLQKPAEISIKETTEKGNEISNDDDETFSACLLVMDDNHRLSEWIAYHYFALKLRVLIVTSDPRSQTSPSQILQKWKTRMTILEWKDDDFADRNFTVLESDREDQRLFKHNLRQQQFYGACIRQLQALKQSWTSFVDIDEFLTLSGANAGLLRERYLMKEPESVWKALKELTSTNTELRDTSLYPAAWYDYFQNGPCVTVGRALFSAVESAPAEQDVVLKKHHVPAFINATRFDTLRWRYRAYPTDQNNGLGKSMIDVSRLAVDDLFGGMNAHRPANACPSAWIACDTMPIGIYHYLGSWESYTFRADARKAVKGKSREKVWRKTAGKVLGGTYDGIQSWVAGFVSQVGEGEAQILLNDAGTQYGNLRWLQKLTEHVMLCRSGWCISSPSPSQISQLAAPCIGIQCISPDASKDMFRRLIKHEKVLLSVIGASGLAIFTSEEERDMTRADNSWLFGSTKTIPDQLKDHKEPLSRLSPVSPIRIFRPNPNLEIAFDVRTRNPVYVMERLQINDDDKSGGRKRHHFYEEQALPEHFRSRNSSYHNSGYDRGHLAPAADFGDAKERLDTYNLANISPQHHEINRKIWAQLESWTRQVARSSSTYDDNTTTYVVTGPIWLPHRMVHEKLFEYQYLAIGAPPNLVAVPTHFFKIVVVIHNENDEETIVKYACFVVPNNVNDKADTSNQLSDYLVQWTDLERVTGLEFFPSLATTEWKHLADALVVLPANRTKQLLLEDGSVSTKRRRNNKANLAHLCPNGCCQKTDR
ncbi:hypothetical protein MPSEU_001090300 [Mayamaea pseudoterrestris]|nr:hypothetical protein MPSEU_001090300 [Mayamaea pseudoterrestris]